MGKIMNKFTSIEQFRSTCKHVNDRVKYDNESPPTLEFRGTVKLHGTNASVVLHPSGEYNIQSRNNVVDDGHFGFANFIKENIETISSNVNTHVDSATPITIYGEWCGEGIQKGVALSQLPKMFVVFAVSYGTGEDKSYHDSIKLDDVIDFNSLKDLNIFDINQFESYMMKIDFSKPALSTNDLVAITNEVEAECPVGKHFIELLKGSVISQTEQGDITIEPIYSKLLEDKCKGIFKDLRSKGRVGDISLRIT